MFKTIDHDTRVAIVSNLHQVRQSLIKDSSYNLLKRPKAARKKRPKKKLPMTFKSKELKELFDKLPEACKELLQ